MTLSHHFRSGLAIAVAGVCLDLRQVSAMWRSVGINLGRVALVTLVIGIAACGGDGDDNPTTPAKAASRGPAQDLEKFLMRDGEEPGFRRGAGPGAMPRSRNTISGVTAFAKEMHLTPADTRRLRSDGFISFTVQPIRGPSSAGVSNVALYETAQGAQHSLAHDLRPDVIRAAGTITGLKFFRVPSIPGARGWNASEPHVGNVLWVQGRCVLTLGNQGPGPFAGPLSRAARAIYERTNGQCPERSASSGKDAAAGWPAPADPLANTVAAGLKATRTELLTHHAHTHLDVFVDGKRVAVPAGIGINIHDPEVKPFDEPGGISYGGIERCRKPCISPLHTHDASGIIHTEASSAKALTLGQLFTEWGVRLDESCVRDGCDPEPIAFYIDGKRYRQDPRAIPLTDRKEIAIVIGTPPPRIPTTADFSNA